MKKKPLKIYLGDLTYSTVAVSTNAIPLNIGYVASHCIDFFKTEVEIELFKFIDDLESAILNSPPDILGLSNYCWNQNIGHEMFSLFHKINPQGLAVWGGPNFHKIKPLQEKWLNQFPENDVYILLEGESGFNNLIKEVLKLDDRINLRDKIRSEKLNGAIVRDLEGKYIFGGPGLRIANLDKIPSPYLTGILDKFFDDRLDPYIQTSRGCPFTCAFCVDGAKEVKVVNRFCVDRVIQELNYIAKRVSSKVHTLGITDLNFGMYKGDLDICDAIVDIQKKYNYPRSILTATGKNAKEKIIECIKRLKGTLKITMAVQSMDKEVLKNINRSNISEEKMMKLAPAIVESGLQPKAEVIIGLAGDSYKSHLHTLKILINAGIGEIITFTNMLLPGSEQYEKKDNWGFITKHRMLPRDFTKISSGKVILETEEVVIASDSMTFEEYVKLRLFNFLLTVANTAYAFNAFKKFLKENEITIFDLVTYMIENLELAEDSIQKVCNDYKLSTANELWDSAEEIHQNYQNENEYKKLVNGIDGINVAYHYRTVVMQGFMSELTAFIFECAKNLLKEKKLLNDDLLNEYKDVLNHSLGISHNPLGKNRMYTNPSYEFNHDIVSWLKDKDDKKKIFNFRLSSTNKIEFKYSEVQYQFIQDQLDRFPDNIVGASKALFGGVIIPAHYFWRKASLQNNLEN